MSAQPATAAILTYGPQGTQQAATAVLLSYSPPPAAARRVVATFGAPWGQAAPQAVETRAAANHPDPLDTAARAPWGEGAPEHREARTAWAPPSTMDRERSAPWQQFARRLQPQSAQPWGVARPQNAPPPAPRACGCAPCGPSPATPMPSAGFRGRATAARSMRAGALSPHPAAHRLTNTEPCWCPCEGFT